MEYLFLNDQINNNQPPPHTLKKAILAKRSMTTQFESRIWLSKREWKQSWIYESVPIVQNPDQPHRTLELVVVNARSFLSTLHFTTSLSLFLSLSLVPTPSRENYMTHLESIFLQCRLGISNVSPKTLRIFIRLDRVYIGYG